MRISELADATGVPLATVKYYLRERLLHPGRPVSARLADYDDSHVRRLHLLRVLREVGDVPVDRLRALVRAAEDDSTTVHEMFAHAADALAATPTAAGPERPFTREVADALIAQAGWTDVREDSVDRENLASVLEVIMAQGTHPPDPEEAVPYLEAADRLARYEIAHLDAARGREGLLEEMVVGQVVFGELLMVLRRLAEEHHSQARFGRVLPHADGSPP